MANVIYERTNPNVAGIFGNVAAALDRTLSRQHAKVDEIGKDVGSLLNTAAGYIDERNRAKDLEGSIYSIRRLEARLAELKKEESDLMSELTALEASTIEASTKEASTKEASTKDSSTPMTEETDQQKVDQATDYMYLG